MVTLRDTLDALDVGGDPEAGDLAALEHVEDLVTALDHGVLEAASDVCLLVGAGLDEGADLGLHVESVLGHDAGEGGALGLGVAPGEAAEAHAGQVLGPLDVGAGDAHGVGEQVRQHDHAVVGEDLVGARGARPVGALGHHPRRHVARVALVNHALQRGRHQHVALHCGRVGMRLIVPVGEAAHAARRDKVLAQCVGVDARVVVGDDAITLGDSDNFSTCLVNEMRSPVTYITQPLHNERAIVQPRALGQPGALHDVGIVQHAAHAVKET